MKKPKRHVATFNKQSEGRRTKLKAEWYPTRDKLVWKDKLGICVSSGTVFLGPYTHDTVPAIWHEDHVKLTVAVDGGKPKVISGTALEVLNALQKGKVII